MTEPRDDEPSVDLGRRTFFRRFAGDVVNAASSAIGAVQVLQTQSAEAARDLLGDPTPPPGLDAPPTGYRSAFRWDGDVCLVVDQRRLPEALSEYSFRTAAEAAFAIREGIVRGAPAIGQVAAIGLALTAGRHRTTRGYARRAQLRGAASALRASRPSVADLGRAVDRMLARLEAVGGALADGDAVADALRVEAESIVLEAATAHGALAAAGAEALPWPDDRPLRVLTSGHSGILAGGQAGTALAIVTAAHHAGRAVEVVVAETRPELLGARLTAWELTQAGVAYTLVTDSAAVSAIAAGRVDAVLVGAERVAADGAVAVTTGGYALAVAAARHGLPFIVGAPSSTLDPAVPDADGLPRELRRVEAVTSFRGLRVAPAGAVARDPVVDAIPPELVTMLVTDAGLFRAPYRDAIAAAVAARPGPPSVAAEVEQPGAAGAAEAADPNTTADPDTTAEPGDATDPDTTAEPGATDPVAGAVAGVTP